MAPLLEIENLHKHFVTGTFRRTEVRALNGVDLQVSAGESVGIVGESGCGKTTLARCALGLIPPTEGTVRFDGIDLSALPGKTLRRRRRQFQLIFQEPSASLNPLLSIRQILSEPLQAQKIGDPQEREEWIRDLLREVSLPDEILESLPARLSGGQQQRIVIARALALKPRLLIADEPVSALDASIQAQILNLLAELQKRAGLALVLISHSLPVVRHLCARVAVMYCGRIVEEAPIESLFLSPKHPYTELLLACEAGSPRGETPLPQDVLSPATPTRGCCFQPRCTRALPVCSRATPALAGIDSGEKVACFLYNQRAASS
jgi:oligopeptide/dipeptide ABC transporter ATP-binding protein